MAYQAQLNNDLASANWLRTHFRIKSHQRIHQINSLPIEFGDRVLDIGSGPGIYARHIAQMIGERGRILCLDRDPQNIDCAEQNLAVAGLNNFSLEMGDFGRAIEIIEKYDVALMFNALCYVPDHVGFIRKLCAAARPGTRIIIKDFDMGAFVFGNICPQKWGELIAAALHGDRTKNPLPYKNFFGREVHFLSERVEFSKSKNMVWTQHINAPFTPSAIEYVWENIRSLLDQAYGINSKSIEYFMRKFNITDGSFYREDGSFFIENEFVTVLTV